MDSCPFAPDSAGQSLAGAVWVRCVAVTGAPLPPVTKVRARLSCDGLRSRESAPQPRRHAPALEPTVQGKLAGTEYCKQCEHQAPEHVLRQRSLRPIGEQHLAVRNDCQRIHREAPESADAPEQAKDQ